jgi:UDP-N-acetylglucosamine--N-acetylmuramyl-(pentapeptide) pyrophosphoryl-undecaprenol N-acetylglucosamine transferase
MKKVLRIAYTGGGTAGHLYPLLAVADEVKKEIRTASDDIVLKQYYFGNPALYADEFMMRNIKIRRIAGAKLRRYASLLNIIDAFKFPYAFLQALIKLLFVMPDVLFSKGGTGALPVVLAAWFFRIPVIIHESDSVPGMTNRLSFPFASRIGVGFSKALELVPEGKGAFVGNPPNPSLLTKNDITQEQAKKIFGFDASTPLILILGGSQGSTRINSFILDVAITIAKKYQILHQVGRNNFENISHETKILFENEAQPYKTRYKIVDFLKGNSYKEALIAADIIISRSGSSILEFSLFSKPTILIPLPESGNNHQLINALEFERAGASIVIEEDNLKGDLFLSQIEKILTNQRLYTQMAQSSRSFATPYAAAALAQEIVRLGVRV